jgi:PAS domain S-box-containing protein
MILVMNVFDTQREIIERFGEVPSFFLLAMSTPEVADDLWRHTVNAYIDNPIPFGFKERLFVYLSRDCRVPYCLGRHAALLLSPRLGADAMTGDEIIRLLERAEPSEERLRNCCAMLKSCEVPLEQWPDQDSELSDSVFDCCVAFFLRSDCSSHCCQALRHAMHRDWYQRIASFLSFVRRAHEWTEFHPDLELEPDIQRLLSEHERLATWLASHHDKVHHEGAVSPLESGILNGQGSLTDFAKAIQRKLVQRGRSLSPGIPGLGEPSSSSMTKVSLLIQIQNLAIAATRVGLLIVDAQQPDMPIIFCNTGFEEMTGYSSDEVLGRNCRFLQGDDLKQDAISVMRDAIRRGDECFVTLRNYRKDGTLFWNEVSISPIRDSEDKVTHFVSIQNDVTTHQRLLAEQQRWYQVLDALSNGTSLDGLLRLIVMQAEDAMPGMLASILLLSTDEQASRKFLKNEPASREPRLHLVHAPNVPCAFAEFIDGQRIRPDQFPCGSAAFDQQCVIISDIRNDNCLPEYCEVARKEGLQACWVQPIFSPAGEIFGTFAMYFREPMSPRKSDLELLDHSAQLAGVAIDRASSRDELAASEERLRLAFKATNDAIWDLDVVHDRLWWNERFTNDFGGPNSEESAFEWWQGRIHPDDYGRVRSSRERLMVGNGDVDTRWSTEYRLRRLDGTYALVEDRALRSYDENGKLVRLIGALNDLTQQRALEKEVLEIAAEENWRIGTDLHDGVGQELTGMGMLADALLTSLSRLDSDDSMAAQMRIARKLSGAIDRTLEQVRTLARGMNPVDIDREGLMSAISDMTDRVRELHGIDCDFECDRPVLFRENQTATQLYRIAQEAMTNAIRHAKATRVTITLSHSQSELSLQIVDNGTGIPEKEPLRRGLGLKTMSYRAGLIGGHLTIRSIAGGGTAVACLFPKDAVE